MATPAVHPEVHGRALSTSPLSSHGLEIKGHITGIMRFSSEVCYPLQCDLRCRQLMCVYIVSQLSGEPTALVWHPARFVKHLVYGGRSLLYTFCTFRALFISIISVLPCENVYYDFWYFWKYIGFCESRSFRCVNFNIKLHLPKFICVAC